MRTLLFAFVLAGAAMLISRPARGQKREHPGSMKAKPVPEATASVPLPANIARRLRSKDPRVLQAALDDVRMSARAGAPAVPAVAELLRAGLSAPLTKAAIETLGDTESETASETLAWYTKNRDADIRRASVQALAKTRGAVANQALRVALSDPDPDVRVLSATGLGLLKAKEAVPELFAALEHRISAAAGPIGSLCAAPECERLLGKLGSVPFDAITAGLEQVLLRSAAEVTDDLKLNVVSHVRELGTSEANHFLRAVQSKWPRAGSSRVKQAIDEAVLATSQSPGSAHDGEP